PTSLAPLMVAPNGARRTRADHPAIPVTIAETVATARACFDAGAGAMHFHVRDENQQHVLDAGLYREALTELATAVPEMHLQITTEAVGRYSPAEMRDLAHAVMPPGISIGTIEMIPDREPKPEDIRLYQALNEAGTAIQHICYQPEDVDLLARLLAAADLPRDNIWCLFAIGHYTGRISHPDLIPPFLERLDANGLAADWAICAFAEEENDSLKAAIAHGGKIRVGFENSLFMPDGSIAPDNAARVAAAKALFG
ncbi:MAG: 3-keto-5-aminohexanoate cleavage protein, partial [Candidatus Puniceispirillales bacterium]